MEEIVDKGPILNHQELVEFRLSSIESELRELKSLLIDVPRLKDRVTTLETQQLTTTTEIKEIKNEVQDVKTRPDKKDAEKWRYILDFIFKTFVALAVGYFISKTGVLNEQRLSRLETGNQTESCRRVQIDEQ